MTLLEILERLHAPLAAWATENKGAAEIVGDMAGLFTSLWKLKQKPGGVHVFLAVTAGDSRSEFAEYGREDLSLSIIITRGQSFTLAANGSILRGAAGGRALFDLAEEAREVVRSTRLDGDEPIPNYRGFRTFDGGEMNIDAYELTFKVSRDIPQQSLTEEESTDE